MPRFYFAALLIFALFSFGAQGAAASTETRNFQPPTVRGVTLNWCKHNGRECGQPAADLFCSQNGYDRAQSFQHDPRAGVRGVQSVIFGDGMLCDGAQCQAFGSILCVKRIAAPAPQKPQPTPAPEQTDQAEHRPLPLPAPSTAPSASPRPAPRPLVSVVGPGTQPPEDEFVPIIPMRFFAKGARLWWCQSTNCEFATQTFKKVIPGSARSERFKSDLSAIPWAKAGLWQVSSRPFPPFQGTSEDANFNGMMAFGLVGPGKDTFQVNFDQAVADSPFDYLSTIYVRVIPLRSIIGSDFSALPSNAISVLYGADAPEPPDVNIIEFDTSPLGLFDIEITEFQLPEFYDGDRWGCITVVGHDFATPLGLAEQVIADVWPIGLERCPEPYRGDGTRVDSLEDFANWAVDSFDWVGEAYDSLMELASNIIMDYKPFGLQCKALSDLTGESQINSFCETAADAAVAAGATALGLPPTIPSYNELIDKGVDYAVELAVNEIESRTGVPCVGPCEEAMRVGLQHFADELKLHPEAPGCVDPKEAHSHGAEPLCVPPGVITRPAPGAETTLPFVQVKVTRTNVAPRALDYMWDGQCSLSIWNSVRQTFPAQRWWIEGTQPARSLDLPEQKVTGSLYAGVGFPLDINMAAGEELVISTSLSVNSYGFPWMIEEWSKYQTVGPHIGHYKRDWFSLYFGGTMTTQVAAGSSGGISCTGTDGHADQRVDTLPTDWPY